MQNAFFVSQFDRVLRSSHMRCDPWCFAYIDELLPEEICRDLLCAWTTVRLSFCSREDGRKSYRFHTAPLTNQECIPDGVGRDLVRFLGGAEYRTMMADFTGLVLDGCKISLDLWEYRGGHWLAPHVDKPDKVLTQIIYLSEGWERDDGGRLLVMRDEAPSSVEEALVPRLGSSAIIVRSAASWHAVEPLSQRAPPRRSLTIMFRAAASRAVRPAA